MRTVLVAVALAAAAAVALSTTTSPGRGPGLADGPTRTAPVGATTAVATGPYAPPVDAPVSDPFRPPSTPYGPGNRGLEYATVPGATARAIGAGTVTFAGRVAGRGVVTVEHPDGLRSSLTGLVEVRVAAGDRVALGDVLGTTAAVLHLGVRRGDVYQDPAALFVGGPPRHAVLVPVPR
ncbi:murein hydrolase activator EnvC family protein [Dermatobacter hominis]|uniref:murein hydrolase activator EnvC family protein n=1 Tax=Dermatobacter hominis TaxID=2884263 RepID=UPI001D118ED0|nr:M23 family metallopeptidase [Dermatobacter hominis]UDY36865.1 M23 family metallopeptidase [Dermatobacter hominis]